MKVWPAFVLLALCSPLFIAAYFASRRHVEGTHKSERKKAS